MLYVKFLQPQRVETATGSGGCKWRLLGYEQRMARRLGWWFTRTTAPGRSPVFDSRSATPEAGSTQRYGSIRLTGMVFGAWPWKPRSPIASATGRAHVRAALLQATQPSIPLIPAVHQPAAGLQGSGTKRQLGGLSPVTVVFLVPVVIDYAWVVTKVTLSIAPTNTYYPLFSHY